MRANELITLVHHNEFHHTLDDRRATSDPFITPTYNNYDTKSLLESPTTEWLPQKFRDYSISDHKSRKAYP